MTGEHAKPTLAFIVLAVLATGVIGSSYRSDANDFAAQTTISKHTPATQSAVPAERPAGDERDDTTNRDTWPSRGGTERVPLSPATIVIHDSGDLSAGQTGDGVDTEQWLPRADGAGHPKKRSRIRDGGEHGNGHGHEHGEHDRRATDD